MDQIKSHVKTAFKIFIFFSAVTIITSFIIYKLYQIIFGVQEDWYSENLIIYSLIISFFFISNYKQTVVKITIEDKYNFRGYLKELLKHRPWRIISEDDKKIILYPKFDRPYSWIYKERIIITIADDYIELEGAKIYIDKIQSAINNKESIWDKKIVRYLRSVGLIFLVTIPILINLGIVYKIESCYHEFKVRNIEKISLKENFTLGNSQNNINNYGGIAENDDYIFYFKDHLELCRSDKNFKNETYLIDKSSGSGMSYLNVIDDWIFYRSGKTLNRMKVDGTKKETIYYLGYILDIHVLDNWIYFINYSDNFKIYKMDVNGQNLHRINDTSVQDISIYENRIYYSYEKDGEEYLESMDLNGQMKQLIGNILADDLVKYNGAMYYTNNTDFKLYKYDLKNDKEPQIMIDEEISSFLIVDDWIYFSKKAEDVGYPGTGLFRIDINGKNKQKINDDNDIEYLSSIGDWVLFLSGEDNRYPSLKRINIKNNMIIQMD